MIEGRNTIKVDGIEVSIEALADLFRTLDHALIKARDGRIIYCERKGDDMTFKVLQS